MRILGLAAVVLLSGCSLSTINRVALVASTAALACDWGQTRGVAAAGADGEWHGPWESNPFMGEHPDVVTVDGYFATAAGINAFAWVAVPRRYRWVIPSAVFVAQAIAVIDNAQNIEGSVSASKRMNGYACGM